MKRSFTLTLDAELAEAFADYMGQEGLSSPADAARTLIRRQLAASPLDGAMRSSQLRAYNETKSFVLTKTVHFFDLIREQLDETRSRFETTTGAGGNGSAA